MPKKKDPAAEAAESFKGVTTDTMKKKPPETTPSKTEISAQNPKDTPSEVPVEVARGRFAT